MYSEEGMNLEENLYEAEKTHQCFDQKGKLLNIKSKQSNLVNKHESTLSLLKGTACYQTSLESHDFV